MRHRNIVLSITRYAVYFTPAQDHPLSKAAETWLGYSPWSGEPVERSSTAALDANLLEQFTTSARKYGFHATMKAPFRLADGQSEAGLRNACEQFASVSSSTEIERLTAKQLDTYFALVPERQSNELRNLAADAVEHFEPFRAALTEAETQRRLASPLTGAQRTLLSKWGYPYVFDEFRFHLTLGGGVAPKDQAVIASAINTHFAHSIDQPLAIDRIALFRQNTPDSAFEIIGHYELSKVQSVEPLQ